MKTPENILINLGKKTIKDREENALEMGLTNEFLEGFKEGIAEIIAALTGEGTADTLEQLDP